MNTTTLKCTAATIGVLAGLLASTAPAGAQIGPATIAVTASGGWDPTHALNKGSLAAAEQEIWGHIVYVGSGGVTAAKSTHIS
jgi:hypothetical protein